MRISSMTLRRRSGFTLVELLVVIAIIAMLVSLMLPAVLSMRSAARRAQCQNQLLQLIMAAQNYEMANERFPAGVIDPAPGPILSVPQGHHYGWIISLLPYLDEENVHRRIDFDAGVYAAANKQVRDHVLPTLICPEEGTNRAGANSSFAACHEGQETPINSTNRGVFFLNSQITTDDVRDGLAQTIFMGEKRIDADDLGWMSGTRATLRNTGSPLNSERAVSQLPNDAEVSGEVPRNADDGADSSGPGNAKTDLSVGGFGSSHPGGAHVVFGDGRIQFMTHSVDPRVYQLLGDRDDGALLSVEDYRE